MAKLAGTQFSRETGNSSYLIGGYQNDGLSILREMRGAGLMAPVLMLTARDTKSDCVRGLDSGADDYLCKPFDFDELLARVRALSRRGGAVVAPVLKYSDVKVDMASHRVERDGKRIELTAKEHALLVLFLLHPEQLLSRTRIYEHVWDDHFDGQSNTLEVHVMELRRKLEKYGSRLIHTLRGRGYSFGESSQG